MTLLQYREFSTYETSHNRFHYLLSFVIIIAFCRFSIDLLQVNLEYLARVCFNNDGLLYPDSVVGTDSHTTMINGLGVVGWGVGGIEAEAVMLGQPISMVLPQAQC